jgi:hypothetical protein
MSGHRVHYSQETTESVLAEVRDVWAAAPGRVTVRLFSLEGRHTYRVDAPVSSAPQRGARVWLQVKRGKAELV